MGWTIEQWASLAGIISTFWLVFTTVLVFWQLRLQRRSVDNDQRRFMRESISIIHDTLQGDDFRSAREKFFEQDNGAYHNLTDDEKANARSILSVYGMLARMVEHQAIDEVLFRNYWKSALVRDWQRIAFFVEGERKKSRNTHLYNSTEQLVNRWQIDATPVKVSPKSSAGFPE